MTRDESVATNGDRVNTVSYYSEISAVMFCHTNQMPVCSLVICILRAYSVWVLHHAIFRRVLLLRTWLGMPRQACLH